MSFFTRTATHPTTPPASADPAIPGTVTPNKPGEVILMNAALPFLPSLWIGGWLWFGSKKP